MASAGIESSPNAYYGSSPHSPAIANLCSYSPSLKEPSLIGTSTQTSKPPTSTRVKFSVPNEKVKGKTLKDMQGRRKRCLSTSDIGGSKKKKGDCYVLPTKFLLGGNACDPLNLQGLAEGRQSAQVTPESSPFATPSNRKEIEVYIPANVHDPLNLIPLLEECEEAPKPRARSMSQGQTGLLPLVEVSTSLKDAAVAPKPTELKIKVDQLPPSEPRDDMIVSPVIPQPVPVPGRSPPAAHRKKIKVCTYGNYSRYYGYRNPNHDEDIRLTLLKREYFEGKAVLDIGCNIGHITWSLARDFKPERVTGIDIDQDLISIARKNMKYYVDDNVPAKLKSLFGHFRGRSAEVGGSFPHNITFATTNYVLPKDDLLEIQTPDYDTILCLSVSKWVHLNWGDEGVRRLFCRVFKQLKPGGKFILEPQNWQSYKKKKKLTPKIFETFKKITLRPYMFPDYLTKEVGFAHFDIINVPELKSKGFQRPIYVYHKAPESESVESRQMEIEMKDHGVVSKSVDEMIALATGELNVHQEVVETSSNATETLMEVDGVRDGASVVMNEVYEASKFSEDEVRITKSVDELKSAQTTNDIETTTSGVVIDESRDEVDSVVESFSKDKVIMSKEQQATENAVETADVDKDVFRAPDKVKAQGICGQPSLEMDVDRGNACPLREEVQDGRGRLDAVDSPVGDIELVNDQKERETTQCDKGLLSGLTPSLEGEYKILPGVPVVDLVSALAPDQGLAIFNGAVLEVGGEKEAAEECEAKINDSEAQGKLNQVDVQVISATDLVVLNPELVSENIEKVNVERTLESVQDVQTGKAQVNEQTRVEYSSQTTENGVVCNAVDIFTSLESD